MFLYDPRSGTYRPQLILLKGYFYAKQNNCCWSRFCRQYAGAESGGTRLCRYGDVRYCAKYATGQGPGYAQAGPVLGYDSLVTGTNDYADTANSDIVVVTSGFPRKPGMTRDDLVKKNQEIVSQVTEQVVKYSPNCIMIMVTNPLDAMAQLALSYQWFPAQPRHGYGGCAGYCPFPHLHRAGSWAPRCAMCRPMCWVDMAIPWCRLARMCTVAGVPISQLIPAERIEQIVQRTRDGGAEIVKLLGNWQRLLRAFGLGAANGRSILLDKKMIMPCCRLPAR